MPHQCFGLLQMTMMLTPRLEEFGGHMTVLPIELFDQAGVRYYVVEITSRISAASLDDANASMPDLSQFQLSDGAL